MGVQIYDYKYTAENGLQVSRLLLLFFKPPQPNDPTDGLYFVYFILRLYAEIPF